MGKKSTSAAKSKEDSSDPKEAALTGVFTSDVPILCSREGILPIAVHTRGSGMSQRFTFLIDYDESETDITTVHVRGWLLSDSVATVLSNALASCKMLNSIQLWNVGLNLSTLETVVKISCEHNIRELALDGNILSSVQPFIDLLKSKSLVKISMKSCGITDQFLQDFSPLLIKNGTLLHLNLSCNSIGDDGCAALASSLRLNRTLLSLSLVGNVIGDKGAASLAKVLSRFPLNHSEIVQRRQLQSTRAKPEEGTVDKASGYNRCRSPFREKPASKAEKVTGNKTKKGEQKKEEKLKKDDKGSKKEVRKGKGTKDGKGGKKGADLTPESPQLETLEVINPLIDLQVEKEDDQLILPGNTSLVYLGLAYNEIGSVGVHSLLEALRVQRDRYSHLGPGVLKLILHYNNPRTHGVKLAGHSDHDLEEIENLLTKRNADDTEAETQNSN